MAILLKSYLEVTSYAGVVAGASHYYGAVTWRDGDDWHEHRLERALKSEAEVMEYRSYREEVFPDVPQMNEPKVGDIVTFFKSEESLRAVAVEFAVGKWADRVLLFRGSRSTCDPMPVLAAADRELLQRLSSIWGRFQENDFWDGDEKVAESICSEWEAVLAEVAS